MVVLIPKYVINDVSCCDWRDKTWVLHHILTEFNLFFNNFLCRCPIDLMLTAMERRLKYLQLCSLLQIQKKKKKKTILDVKCGLEADSEKNSKN